MNREPSNCHDITLLGLTGNIGSGKSSVSKVFEAFGCEVVDADKVAKQLYFMNEVKRFVIKELGTSSYENDKPSFSFIAQSIFSDSSKYNVLTQFLKPLLKSKIIAIKEENRKSGKILLLEAAMLFEYELEDIFDRTICVYADYSQRSKRVIARDLCKQEDFEKRESYQWDQERKMLKANFLINNNEEFAVIPQVEKILKSLKTL